MPNQNTAEKQEKVIELPQGFTPEQAKQVVQAGMSFTQRHSIATPVVVSVGTYTVLELARWGIGKIFSGGEA